MRDSSLFAPDRDQYLVPECFPVIMCSEGKLMVGSDANSEDWDIDDFDFLLDLCPTESITL